VEQIAHKSMFIAKNSCDEIILRVKRDPLFNCSIGLLFVVLSRPRLITELTTQPHSSRAHTQTGTKTSRSCGFSSSTKTLDYQDAGRVPAFFLRARLPRLYRARRAEFISVSGQCAARSAHFSDLRNHKRSSGGVAATEHLHAPMNSPAGSALAAAQRVSFSTSALTCIEGDSSWL
jgi:hypothetical protein